MRFSQTTHLLMFLSVETLTPIIRTDLPIVVELINLVNLQFFYIKSPYWDEYMDNFPTWIPDCDSHGPAFLDLFLSSDASICSTIAFSPLGNSDHVVVPVSIEFLWVFIEYLSTMAFSLLGNSDHVVSNSIEFPSNSQWDATFHRIAHEYSCVDWIGLCDHLRDVPWEDIFKPGASAAASEFCEWIQVGIDIYIPHRKYQVSLIHLHGFQLPVLLP